MFDLRPLRHTDTPFLWEMLYHAIFVPEGKPAPAKSIVRDPSLSHYVQDWGQLDDMGVIATLAVDETAVGAIWGRQFDPLNPGYGFVDAQTPELSIAILPEYRGQGLGTRLLDALFEMMRGRYTAVSLSVSPENPALRLYQRVGFVEISRQNDSFVMIKQL